MTVQSEFSTFYVVPHSHIGSQNEEIYGPGSAFRREKQSERELKQRFNL